MLVEHCVSLPSYRPLRILPSSIIGSPGPYFDIEILPNASPLTIEAIILLLILHLPLLFFFVFDVG